MTTRDNRADPARAATGVSDIRPGSPGEFFLSDDPDLWLDAFVDLARNGRSDALLSALAQREQAQADSIVIVNKCLTGLMKQAPEAFVEVLRHWPDGNLYAPLAYYFRSHFQLHHGQIAEAITSALEARNRFEPYRSQYESPQARSAQSFYRQCMNVMDEDFMNRLAKRVEDGQAPTCPSQRPEAGFTLADPQYRPERPFLLVAADQVYLNRYATGFLQSIAPHMAGQCLHIHALDIAAPETLMAGLRDAFPKLQLAFSFERTSAMADLNRTTYYACSRFFVLPWLLSHYQQNAAVFDIDLICRGGLDAYLHTAAEADFACHIRPGYGLGGFTRAGATSFSRGPGRAFLSLANGYMWERMTADPKNAWYVDQVALARTLFWYTARNSDFRVANLASMAGAFEDHFTFPEFDESEFKLGNADR